MEIIQSKDYEQIARLNKSVHDLHHSWYPDVFKPYDYENIKYFFQQIMKEPTCKFLLVQDDSHAVGYAWAEIIEYKHNPFRKDVKLLYQIAIDERYRSKGYGEKLMDALYSVARKNEIKRIELDYWVQNVMADTFYKKEGFKKTRAFVYKEL
ncbi:GNAT family N-acetyltransferase [Aquibacillus koreensis]|uniref:GNAT family N-acetyltransferase n=1 Tax=Aquibacillus koreensis TaxID=279446 RepID=A0A9X4AHQ6_9BACI|nr:GNAT family N-acetyltransferase [Aquibacillus koreensis]MCT2535750.1 GNAT family N-acetyltransferase [Aquibacillus koreensis]MDC3420206.1 GNAT family N-acetyltransferase [Aquibacillus koreensis]